MLVRVVDDESNFVQELLGPDADASEEHIPVVLVKNGRRLHSTARRRAVHSHTACQKRNEWQRCVRGEERGERVVAGSIQKCELRQRKFCVEVRVEMEREEKFIHRIDLRRSANRAHAS